MIIFKQTPFWRKTLKDAPSSPFRDPMPDPKVLAKELEAKLPELQRLLVALEDAKRISPEVWRSTIVI